MFRFSPLTLAVCALCLTLVTGCQNKKTPQDYLASGDRFYEQQELEKARIEYRNALALDANSAAAHYGLATIARDKKNSVRASSIWAKRCRRTRMRLRGSSNMANSPC